MSICPTVADYTKVTYGSAIKLQHKQSGFRLHSHQIKWGSGSGQQSVTGFEGSATHAKLKGKCNAGVISCDRSADVVLCSWRLDALRCCVFFCFSADDPNSLWQLTSGFVANNPVLAAPGTVIKCNDVIRLVRRQEEHSWPLFMRLRQGRLGMRHWSSPIQPHRFMRLCCCHSCPLFVATRDDEALAAQPPSRVSADAPSGDQRLRRGRRCRIGQRR